MASTEVYTLEEEALIRQWLEYKKVVLDRLTPQSIPLTICQELNNELKNKTFLAGTKYSTADLEMVLALAEFYASQSMQVKEKYIYLSRWFSHIQHLQSSLMKTSVSFSRGLLY